MSEKHNLVLRKCKKKWYDMSATGPATFLLDDHITVVRVFS